MISRIVCTCECVCVGLLCHKFENVEHFQKIIKSIVICNACLLCLQLNHKIPQNNLKQITKNGCGDEFCHCHRIYCSLNVILMLSNKHTHAHCLALILNVQYSTDVFSGTGNNINTNSTITLILPNKKLRLK